MAKTPTKKKYVVTYYRTLDGKRSQKTGAKIPLRTKLVDAINSEDAAKQVKTDARFIVSAKLRGRGGLKKNPGFYTAGTVIVQPGGIEFIPVESFIDQPEASEKEIVDAFFKESDADFEAVSKPASSLPVVAVSQWVEEPQEVLAETAEIADQPEAVAEASEPDPELTEEEKAEQLEREAQRAEEARLDAIALIDTQIDFREWKVRKLREQLEFLTGATERSIARYEEIGNDVHNLETRLNLRPIAIEAIENALGVLPPGIPGVDETLAEDAEAIEIEIGIQHHFDMIRAGEMQSLKQRIDKETLTIEALRYLRSELTGEPFDEDEDDEDDEMDTIASDEASTPLNVSNLLTFAAIFLLSADVVLTPHTKIVRLIEVIFIFVLSALLFSPVNNEYDAG